MWLQKLVYKDLHMSSEGITHHNMILTQATVAPNDHKDKNKRGRLIQATSLKRDSV